jgi:hypothetical protein
MEPFLTALLIFVLTVTLISVWCYYGTEKYYLGRITFKSFDTRRGEYSSYNYYYFHCILIKGSTTKNLKITVTKDVFDKYEINDDFAIKD